MRLLIRCTLAILILAALPACTSSALKLLDLGGTYTGAPQTLGQGTVWSWVRTDSLGNPASMGLRMSASALNGLPATMTEVIVPMPATGAAPFDHIGLDWNPQGHPPPGIYDVPHLDLHFYMMSQAERQMITNTGANVALVNAQPAAAEIPTGYVATPNGGVPTMGMHWYDPASPEYHGQPFKTTLIYGFYNGHINFIEPMVAKSFLDSKLSYTGDFARPAQYVLDGYYPSRYSVSYDSAKNEYEFSLSLMVHF